MIGMVREVTPEVDASAVLAGAQFIDAFRVEVGAAAVNAREACTRMVLDGPRWIDALLRLRNAAMLWVLVTAAALACVWRHREDRHHAIEDPLEVRRPPRRGPPLRTV